MEESRPNSAATLSRVFSSAQIARSAPGWDAAARPRRNGPLALGNVQGQRQNDLEALAAAIAHPGSREGPPVDRPFRNPDDIVITHHMKRADGPRRAPPRRANTRARAIPIAPAGKVPRCLEFARPCFHPVHAARAPRQSFAHTIRRTNPNGSSARAPPREFARAGRRYLVSLMAYSII